MTFQNINLWIIRIGLFIVPFIPLYISRVLFFPYITGKAFVFRIIVEIVFVAWLLLAIFYKEYRPQKTYLLWAIGIFIAVVTLATVLGINPARSFWSNFERMEGLIAYLHFGAYFLVLGHIFKKKDWLIFFNLFVVAGILENTYALFQWLGYLASPQGGPRSDGTIGNPTYLAAYLIFVLAFCILLWLQTKNKKLKYYYGFAGVFTLAAIYFTASRGPVLALLIGLVVASFLYLFLKRAETSRERLSKKLIAGFLILLFLVPLGLWLLRDSQLVKSNFALQRFTSLSFSEQTISSRFMLWKMSWQGVKEKPILGWGPENYPVVFAKYYNPAMWQQEPWFDRSHNIILDWLINAGILGLLAYLSIFWAALYLLWKLYVKNILSLETGILISVLLLVYLLQNFFVFDNIVTYISFFAVLAYIQSRSGAEDLPVTPLFDKFRFTRIAPVIGLLLASLVLIMYFVNVKPLLANLNLLNALKIQSQDLQGAFENYQKALDYNTLGNSEIREQLGRYALFAGAQSQLNADFRDGILRTAIQEAQKNVQENLLDPRPYLFLGTIYGRVGLLDRAIQILNQALELSPKKQQIYFEIADVQVRKGDFKKAINTLQASLELDPSHRFARLNLAVVYIISGQQEEADKVLIEGFGTVDVTEPRLTQVYSQVKNYDRLIGIRRVYVKRDPNNLEYIKGLAGAYLLNNQNQEAIRVLEDAIQLNPAFKEEAEAYIREILLSN